MFAGVDAKPIKIEYDSNNTHKKFESEIGCIVIVDDYDSFKAEYAKILRKLVSDGQINTGRTVLSSYELLELSGGDYTLLSDFFKRIKPHIKKLNIFYCSFDTRRIPIILTYGKSKLRKMTLDELRSTHLDNAFPHICAWCILPYLKSNRVEVFSDSFTTNLTDAWNEVSSYDNFKIIPNGDSINALISTADIIVKFLEHEFSLQKKSLFRDQINRLLDFENEQQDNCYIHIIDNRDYPKITPLKHSKFKLGHRLKHPAYFLIKTEKSEIEMEFIKFTSEKLLNQISEQNGSLLFFDQRDCFDCIEDGDSFIYLDERAKLTAEGVKNAVGKNVALLSLKEVK